jgi:hypothetical protein
MPDVHKWSTGKAGIHNNTVLKSQAYRVEIPQVTGMKLHVISQFSNRNHWSSMCTRWGLGDVRGASHRHIPKPNFELNYPGPHLGKPIKPSR